jgi:hypothetical protein
MHRRDVTFADKISLLEQIKNQTSNTRHRQLAEITVVPKNTIVRVVQQQEKLRNELTLRHGQQGISPKRKAHREKGSADAVSAEQWKSTKLPDLLQKCSADDISNANETGLYCHAKPDGSLS